ncbi:MAG: acyl-CoA dehydrogenase family protein [Smithellaceae bacterium]|nr:acyl-CoA dehydrogenase family protein [Smithellaceae bacterium]
MHQPDEPNKKYKQAADFAARHVANRPDLQTGQEFPMDLWRKMGEAGLFKIGIPKIHGGTGGKYLDLLKAGEAFVRSGSNLGLGLSWLFQQIIARYVMGTFGTPQQCEQYLRAATCGKCTLSFAVSEPKRGASPKTLATQAKKTQTGYALSGEKTYLTNGPIADIYIVVAVTEDTTPLKSFTAFIVPRDTQGITVTPPLPLNFLKPSPHGGIQLNNCLIGENAVLGKKESAWQDIVVPLGEIEDVVMTGPMLGGMAAQLDLLAAAIRINSMSTDRALQGEWGALSALWQTLRIIAYEAAGRLDRGGGSPLPLGITFARLAAEFHADIAQLSERWKIPVPDQYTDLQRDMESLGVLQKRRLQIRQEKIGATLLKN